LRAEAGQEFAKIFDSNEITLGYLRKAWNELRSTFVEGRGVEAEFQGKLIVSADDFANLCLSAGTSKIDSGAQNELLGGKEAEEGSNRTIQDVSGEMGPEMCVDRSSTKGRNAT